MDEVSELLSRKKILKAFSKPDTHECLLDGSSLGMGSLPIPCIMRSASGGVANITIADGYDTGVEMSVPLDKVTIIGSEKMVDAAKNLFRGK